MLGVDNSPVEFLCCFLHDQDFSRSAELDFGVKNSLGPFWLPQVLSTPFGLYEHRDETVWMGKLWTVNKFSIEEQWYSYSNSDITRTSHAKVVRKTNSKCHNRPNEMNYVPAVQPVKKNQLVLRTIDLTTKYIEQIFIHQMVHGAINWRSSRKLAKSLTKRGKLLPPRKHLHVSN